MEFHLNANRNNLIYSNSSISTLKKTDSVCSDDQNYTNLHNGRQIIIDCYASQIKEIRNSIPQDSDLFDKEIKYCNAQICKHCAYQLDENWNNDYASSENEILSSLLKLVNFEDDEIQKICQFYHFNELFTMSKKEIYIVLNHFISEINLLSLETLDNIFKLIKVTLNQIKHVTDYTYMVPTYSCTNESLNKKFVMRINTSCTMTVKDKFRMMKRYSSVFDCDEIESKDNTNTEHLSAGSTPVSTEKHFFSPATETKKIDHNIHKFKSFLSLTMKSHICTLCYRKIIGMGTKCRNCHFYYHINCSRLCAKTCSISEKPKTKISKSSVKSKRNSSYFKTSRSSTSGFYNSSSTKGNTYSRNSDISESTQISTTRSLNNDALKSVYKTASCMDDFSINNRFSSNEIDHLVVHENALDLLIEKYYIPMNELNEISLVEDGDFGSIYRAQWHGAINIRISKLDVLDEINLEKTYCQMITNLAKTRHEHICLFMGACLTNDYLITMNQFHCGIPLNKYIDENYKHVSSNKVILIASQIAQAISYLHAKNIVHKNLNTKCVLVEKERILVQDLGILDLRLLCYNYGGNKKLKIPNGLLTSIPPEIIRIIKPSIKVNEIQFEPKSDIYAFGTLWYNLICGEKPYMGSCPEAIIRKIGLGDLQSLYRINSPKEFKNLLIIMWSYNKNKRPTASKVKEILNNLPKQMVGRSPSQPLHAKSRI